MIWNTVPVDMEQGSNLDVRRRSI